MATYVSKSSVHVSAHRDYLQSMCTNHTALLTEGHLTDLYLVSHMGGVVPVHRALILPMSPVLTSLVGEVWTPGNPTVILPVSYSAIINFVSIIYRGYCELSSDVVSSDLMDLLTILEIDQFQESLKIEEYEGTNGNNTEEKAHIYP